MYPISDKKYPISLISVCPVINFILILSVHVHLVLPIGLFPSRLLTKNPYAPLLFPMRATWPAYFILIDFITRIVFGEKYRSLSSSLCSFLHSTVTSPLSGPNTFLSSLFSNTHSLCNSLNVRDQVSNPYKRIGEIM